MRLPTATTAAPVPPPEQATSAVLLSRWDGFVEHLSTMSPRAWAISIGLTLITLVIAWAVRKAVHLAVAAVFARTRRVASNGHAAAIDHYGAMVRKFVVVALGVFTFLIIAEIWGFPALQWLIGERRLANSAISIGLILLLTAFAWRGVKIITNYLLATRSSGGTARTATASQIIVSLSRLVIGLFAVLLILGELGINIAPLIAGAGIVGLAIGFGAQSLVKDLLTGLMIVIEDSVAIGDVVRIGEETGKVERLGVRAMRLRAVDGTVHIIPYGGVTVISNMTKDYAFALLDIGIAYRENTDDIAQIMQSVATELQADSHFGPMVLEPMDFMGVQNLADTSVVLRGRIKTVATDRWQIEREFRRRIKREFDARGIEIPGPQMTVTMVNKPPATAAPAEAAKD